MVRIGFIGGLGSAVLMVRLDDSRGLFQPEQFYDSAGEEQGSYQG